MQLQYGLHARVKGRAKARGRRGRRPVMASFGKRAHTGSPARCEIVVKEVGLVKMKGGKAAIASKHPHHIVLAKPIRWGRISSLHGQNTHTHYDLPWYIVCAWRLNQLDATRRVFDCFSKMQYRGLATADVLLHSVYPRLRQLVAVSHRLLPVGLR